MTKLPHSTVRLFISQGPEASDVRYATGFSAPDPFFLVLKGKKRHLLVSVLEAARAAVTSSTSVIHTPSSLGKGGSLGALASLLRHLHAESVCVMPSFPIGIAQKLANDGFSIVVSDEQPFPERAVKTPDEVKYIQNSQKAAVFAMKSAISAIQEASIGRNGVLRFQNRPLTSEILKFIIEKALLERNCSSSEGTIVAIGPQSARPHEEGSGPVRAGQPIVMDIFPRDKTTGYWGDLTRTVVRGPASPELKKLYRTVLQAQRMALGRLRPGVSCRKVHAEVAAFFACSGYPTKLFPPGHESGFIHSTGHSVGLDIHENPGLRNEPGHLAAGNVVTVEPGLYFPGLGGIRIEDTVCVTPSGARLLATCPYRFELR